MDAHSFTHSFAHYITQIIVTWLKPTMLDENGLFQGGINSLILIYAESLNFWLSDAANFHKAVDSKLFVYTQFLEYYLGKLSKWSSCHFSSLSRIHCLICKLS